MLIRTLVCGLMAAARLIELAYSRRNLKPQGPAREGDWTRRTFPLIVALHTVVIGGVLLFGGRRPRRAWLALLLAAQPLRWWVLATLGARWNARGAVAENLSIARDGPYAYVRHPNYSIVAVELWALPAAFGLPGLALAAGVVNAALLAVRVREEEALLMQRPGYAEHFRSRPRFIPFLV